MTDLELKDYKHQVRDMKGSETIKQHNKDIISCIEMINSCLAYHPILENADIQELSIEELNEVLDSVMTDRYMESRIKKVGYNLAVELAKEQLKDIKTVEKGVFTDNEGLTYNQIEWVR